MAFPPYLLGGIYMSNTPIFLMPVKISGSETDLRLFHKAVDSIVAQTDPNWILVMVDDFSNEPKVYEAIDEFKEKLKDRLHVIYQEKNLGAGLTRNTGIKYAKEIGAPFILFNDSDDISDPRRLELVRKTFDEDKEANVVYTSFVVVDQNGIPTPREQITKPVLEIIDGHKVEPVEGENAWINIAIKKKYTNLTSCTAVRTSLAVEEPFPNASCSEDCNTWLRYAAHPGKFVFLRDIVGLYTICRGVASRSRSIHADFYERMFEIDSDGFEKAVGIAKQYGTMGGYDENEVRTAFYVRLGLCLFNGGSPEWCQKAVEKSMGISKERALHYIDILPCDEETKASIRALALG